MSDYKRHYMWNNSDWKEFLDYQNERCPYAGDFSRVVRKNFDPLWGTGISEEDQTRPDHRTGDTGQNSGSGCTDQSGIRGQAAAAGEYPQWGIRVYGRPVPCYYHSL